MSVAGRRLLLLLAVLCAGLLVPAFAAAAKSKPGRISCNGSSALCERKLNEVVLPGSHNSMSAKELGWFNPNHNLAIPGQLRRGARAMLIDTFYGAPQSNGQVTNILKSAGRGTGAAMYLCHSSCLFGNSPLIPELAKIAAFLDANPNEVLIFINEDNVAPDDFASAVEASGLAQYLYTGPAGPWPTLGSMIESDQRVVMLAQSEVGDVPWYHLAYDGATRETPYSFIGVDPLTKPVQVNESCAPFRGEVSATDDSLFLMNHWATNPDPGSFEPLVAQAEVVNTRSAIVSRARACESRRGFLPSIIAVDFFGTGDVVGAANELNRVAARADLSASTARLAKARAGRVASLPLRLKNNGDAPAASIKVCATVPRKLAIRPKCRRISEMRAAAVRPVKLRIRTRKAARGRGTVRIVVRSSAGKLNLKAKIKVKRTRR